MSHHAKSTPRTTAESPSMMDRIINLIPQKPVTPQVDKMFLNQMNFLVDPDFTWEEKEKTKKDLKQKHGIDPESKLYNFNEKDLRKIYHRYKSHSQSNSSTIAIENEINFYIIKLTTLFLCFSLVNVCSMTCKRYKWHRLTYLKTLRNLNYAIAINALNFVMLNHLDQQKALMLQHHQVYEDSIHYFEKDESISREGQAMNRN